MLMMITLGQSYDRVGNVRSESRSIGGVSGLVGSGTFSYTYDGLNRLVGADLDGTTQSYAYDLDGNRVAMTDGGVTTTYTYDRSDELLSQTSGVTKDFAYDKYGNMTQAVDSSASLTSYAYDLADRLVSITPPASSATTFSYDALGRIAGEVFPSGGGTSTFSYVGASDTAYAVSNSVTGTTNATLDAMGDRLAVQSGSTTAFTVADLHGNLAAELDSGLTSVLCALRFDPYGGTVDRYDSGSSFPTPWTYQGELDVSPTASDPLYADGARFYDPHVAAFTQLDAVESLATIGLGGSTSGASLRDPRSLNRFLYAGANPTTYIDPSGHNYYDPTCDCVVPGPTPPGTTPPPSAPRNGPRSGSTADATAAAAVVAAQQRRRELIAANTPPPTADPDAIDRQLATWRRDDVGGDNGIREVSGLLLAPDGTLVLRTQFEHLASACQTAGPPGPGLSGGPCGAWWATEAKVAAAEANGSDAAAATFLSGPTLEGLREALKKSGEELDSAGEAAMTEALAENGVAGSGALYEAGAWESGLGRDLRWTANGALVLGVGVTFTIALDKEVAAGIHDHWSGPEEWARAGIRSGLELLGGGVGGVIGGSLGAAVAPPPWDIATAAIGTGIGASLGEQVGDYLYIRLLGS